MRRWSILLFVCVGLALVPAPAEALRSGIPDPLFGSGGIARVSTAPAGERESGRAMVVDSQDRVLVGGVLSNNNPIDDNGGWMLVRFGSDGTLDTGFGENGFAKAPGLFGPGLGDFGQDIRALALVPGSGKIIAGGASFGPSKNFEFTIARYNADGSLDMSFGPADTGFVKADVSPELDSLKDIAVSPQGTITAVGQAGTHTALARWDSDGVPDPTFDGPGVPGNGAFVDPVTAKVDDYREVQVEPSGAVRAVGVATPESDGNWLIGRYTATGARELSFNGNGIVITNFPGNSDLGGDQVLVDGTLYVFGSVDVLPGPITERVFSVDAFDPVSGAEIPGTKVDTPVPGNLFAATMQRLSGVAGTAGERFLLSGTSGNAVLAGLRRENGSSTRLELDPEFGTGGIVPSPEQTGTWGSVAVDGQNRLVVGGEIGLFETADFGAERFTAESPGGTGDTTAPVITNASIAPRAWAVRPRGRAETQLIRRAKRGTSIRYTLSEAARVVVRIDRRRPGKGKAKGKAKRGRFVGVGSFAQAGVGGKNRKPFSGRIGKRRLRPGRYRATLTATDAAGNASKPTVLRFKIVRPKARSQRSPG